MDSYARSDGSYLFLPIGSEKIAPLDYRQLLVGPIDRMGMGKDFKIDPKVEKKLKENLQKKLDAAQKKHPISADATSAEKKRAVAKIVKAASKMK